jgi:hypothetical protein
MKEESTDFPLQGEQLRGEEMRTPDEVAATGANPNQSVLHSVSIGVPPRIGRSCCRTTTFADSAPRCHQWVEKSGLTTRRSSTRGLPRTSAGKCGLIRSH